MNSYVYDNARFTVLRDGVVRMEYAGEGAFVDEETFFARRTVREDAAFRLEDGILTAETPKLTLTYRGGEFSAKTLSAKIHTGGVEAEWRYGDEPKGNLGGTLKTLDGVSCRVAVPDGVLSRDGFYVVDDSGKTLISGGAATSRDPRHMVDIYLFAYGLDYRAALSDLAAVSGKAALPRKYFFGSWYSRWHAFTAGEYLEIVDEYEDHGFPLDVMVIDMDWHYHDWCTKDKKYLTDFGYGHAGGNLGWTGYTWVKERFPDPAGFLRSLHEKGVAAVLNDHPCDGIRDNEEFYESFIEELERAGYSESVPDVEDLFDLEKHPERETVVKRNAESCASGKKNFRFNAGSPEYMSAFFRWAHRPREREGVDFWWLDWQQDYIYPEVAGTGGMTHLERLNELYYEDSKRDGRRGQGFSRWAGFGDQRHPGHFSGDTVTNFETLAFEIEMTVTAGNSLCFFWSHDIGGFNDPENPKQAECFARWVQFGAVSPALRLHSCGEDTDRRPWLWGEPFCSSMRRSFELRSKLFPYIYSAAHQSSNESVPLLRALYIDLPGVEEAYRHPGEFMLGDGLLAAPVASRGEGEDFVVRSDVWLPEGVWYGLFDGRRYDGGRVHTVTNDSNSFPLFVKAGFPLVTRPYNKSVSAPLTDMTVVVYAGDCEYDLSTELYEDDGITEPDGDDSRVTKIRCRKDGRRHLLTLSPDGDAEPHTRNIVFELHGVGICCGENVSYNEATRTATATFENVPASAELEIELIEE